MNKMIFANLVHRPFRTIISIVAVAVEVTLILLIVGLSIGGLIAQEFYRHHPDRVAALVLCDTAAKIGTDEVWDQRIAQVQRGQAKLCGELAKVHLVQRQQVGGGGATAGTSGASAGNNAGASSGGGSSGGSSVGDVFKQALGDFAKSAIDGLLKLPSK